METILVILEPGRPPRELHLREQKAYRLGRQSDILIEDAHCSRQHLCLKSAADGRLEFRDLGSRNGTYLNGKRTERGHLEAGEYLLLGRTRIQFLPKQITATSYPAVTHGDIIERPDYVR